MKSLTAGLPDADRNRLVQLVAEARSHWTPHHLKLMVGQLAGEATEFRAAALLEFAKVDLAHRWQRDEQILVESYLGQFKELQHSPAVVRDLLQVEIAARRNAGAAPDEQELRNRFPMLGDEVAHVLSESRSRSSEKNVTDEAGQNLAKSTASLASAETIAPNKQTVPPVEDASGGLFDHYRLIKELGHGAMGTVYLAEDTKLRRRVALKRPRIAGAEEAAVLQRFYREAYAAATLNHPNICPVYDIGEFNGIPYITMACIEGRTLAQVIRNGKPLNPRAVAGLVRKLALALSEAHQHGIIHRDLKPGNIMLNQRSEPIVMDFGLARQLDADVEDRLTTDGMLVGTLAYMSPEQVEGDLSRIGPATDIYSLGVVLFELLTGRIPFQGSAGSVIRQIASVAPPAPSALRENVPQELEAICLRMLAKAANARYASMADVAQSLTEWLKSKGEPASMAVPPPVDEILPAQLEARQKQIERMIDAGQWREASLQLQRMIALDQPVAAPFVAWAREQETVLHVRWEEEQQAAARLLADAKEDFARHDYAGAAQRLVKIDKPLLTVEGKQLLEESLKLAEEVDLLIHLIEQGLHGGSQAGMFRNMQRLLQLKPRDPLVRDLYRKFRWQQRLGWIGATLADAFALTGSSRMRKTIEDPMYRKWFAMAALVFLISFGLMSWHVAAYLRSAKQDLAANSDVATQTTGRANDASPPRAVAPFDAVAAAKFQQAWAEHLGVPVEIENSVGIKMRLIPPGEFAMGLSGSDLAAMLLEAERKHSKWTEAHLRAASPQHIVRITQPFYSGTTEVTEAQWNAAMGTTSANDPSSNDELPVVNKSWDDLQEFLRRMSQRPAEEGRVYVLPTEAQWEFACVGGDRGVESDTLGTIGAQAWHSDTSGGRAHSGGELQPNGWGLFDMPGNVWEWCGDRFADDYYVGSAVDDPQGPTTGSLRTLRGGAWSHPPIECGRRFRIGGPPDHRDNDVGFRLAAILKTTGDPSRVTTPPQDYAIEIGSPFQISSLVFNGTYPLTIEAWLRPAELPANGAIVPLAFASVDPVGNAEGLLVQAKEPGAAWKWGAYLHYRENEESPATIGAKWEGVNLTEAIAMKDRWVHLAVVVHGATSQMFVDGKPGPSRDLPVRFTGSKEPLWIGACPSYRDLSNPEPFGTCSGQFDEIRVSRTIRYTTDFTPELRFEPDADTLALFHCDEGSGEQLIDASGNGHHGQVPNIAWVPSPEKDKRREIGADGTLPADAANTGQVPANVPSPRAVNLFNGRDLTGWTASGNAAWKVENNTIVCTSTSRDVLWTDVEYGDFEFELEVRLAAEANSGVFLRAPRRQLTLGKNEFEIQLNDDAAPRSSNLAANVISGAIYNVSAARSRAYRSGQWNKLRIRVVKRNLQVWLNDLLVQDCNLDDFREEFASHPALARERGFIGLQSPISNRAEFRNLKLTAF